MDEDGLRVVAVGTAVFAVAAVVCLLLQGRLDAAGRGDWTSICAAGAGLGLLGLLYCRHRVRSRRRGRPSA